MDPVPHGLPRRGTLPGADSLDLPSGFPTLPALPRTAPLPPQHGFRLRELRQPGARGFQLEGLHTAPFQLLREVVHLGVERQGTALHRLEIVGLVLELVPPSAPPASILYHRLPFLAAGFPHLGDAVTQPPTATPAHGFLPRLVDRLELSAQLPLPVPVEVQARLGVLAFADPFHHPGLHLPPHFGHLLAQLAQSRLGPLRPRARPPQPSDLLPGLPGQSPHPPRKRRRARRGRVSFTRRHAAGFPGHAGRLGPLQQDTRSR